MLLPLGHTPLSDETQKCLKQGVNFFYKKTPYNPCSLSELEVIRATQTSPHTRAIAQHVTVVGFNALVKLQIHCKISALIINPLKSSQIIT